MQTVKDRLREEVLSRPPKGRTRGIRLFQREMKQRRDELRTEGRDLLGATLPTIHGYISPEGPTPSEDFIREAAVVLGVRPEWLLTGEGGRTEEEEHARQQAAARLVEAGHRFTSEHGSTPEEVLEKNFWPFRDLPDYARGFIMDAVRRIARDRVFARTGELHGSGELHERVRFEEEIIAAAQMARDLSRPLEGVQLGGDLTRLLVDVPTPAKITSQSSLERITDFAISVAQGLVRLVPTPHERLAIEHERERQLNERAERHETWKRENPEEYAARKEWEKERAEWARERRTIDAAAEARAPEHGDGEA